MSYSERGGQLEESQQHFDEVNLMVGSTMAAIFLTPASIVARALFLLLSAPGGDLNQDGAFSISDVFACGRWAFLEPAWHVLAWLPIGIWQFFELSTYSMPGWIMFVVAAACWFAAGIAVYFAATVVGRVFGNLGKGVSIGIGKVQMRLPQLMGTDIVIMAVVIVVVGGFAIGSLMDSFGV